MNELPLLIGLASAFFLIAMLYSSVGFGGGSSYLAILSLFLTDFLEIKTISLVCNLAVATTGTYFFVKQGYFDKKKFFRLAICSIPAAFIGATVHLTEVSFFIALGSILSLSGILLLIQIALHNSKKENYPTNYSWFLNIGLGASTGFLAGLVGIGGGILISPILNLFKLEDPKKIAALASFFILVNSGAGLIGQVSSHSFQVNFAMVIVLLISVLFGSQFGTRVSLKILKPSMVKGITGILVYYVGLKLLLKYGLSIDI